MNSKQEQINTIQTVIQHMETADCAIEQVNALMTILLEYTSCEPLHKNVPFPVLAAYNQVRVVNSSCITISDLIANAAENIKHAIETAYSKQREIIAGE